MDDCTTSIDELSSTVNEIEKKVKDLEQFYLKLKQGCDRFVSLEKEEYIPGMKKLKQDASRREAAAAKRMQDLMRQFGSIFRQITQDKYAWPFMHPVDAKALGLRDYYQIIDRPMDFSTIKNQMEGKGGTCYRHVIDICSDVRLVFTNAMKYNEKSSDIHMMAKNLSEKFEEKWLQFLPKFKEVEKQREEEEAQSKFNMQLAQEAAHAKLAKDLHDELSNVYSRIEQLSEMVVQGCRQMSDAEKRTLGIALVKLQPEDLRRALQVVAQHMDFDTAAEEVELDISAQSESTLWRLKLLASDALENRNEATNNGNEQLERRKREICDLIAETQKKREKKNHAV